VHYLPENRRIHAEERRSASGDELEKNASGSSGDMPEMYSKSWGIG